MLPRFQPGEVWQHLARREDPVTVFMGVRAASFFAWRSVPCLLGPHGASRLGPGDCLPCCAACCLGAWLLVPRHRLCGHRGTTVHCLQVPTMYSKLLSAYEHMDAAHQQQAAAAARRVSGSQAAGLRGGRRAEQAAVHAHAHMGAAAGMGGCWHD